MGIRMFGRGQLELGTDTVRCQGESNGQAAVPAIDVESFESRMILRMFDQEYE
jgi:hypothetical protein